MKKNDFLLLLLFCTLISNNANAQSILKGKIVDIITNQPLPGANIQLKGSNKGATSDQNGIFQLELPSVPATIVLSFVGYESLEEKIEVDHSEQILFALIPKVNELEEITVRSQEKVESLSDLEQYSIIDFEVVNDYIYRLEFHGSFKKHVLSITDMLGQVLASTKIKRNKQIQSLYKSCTDQIYVVGKKNAYAISSEAGQLNLSPKIQVDTFNRFLKTCKLANDDKLYYITEFYNGLLREVSMYDVPAKKRVKLNQIFNEDQLNNYLNDFGYIKSTQRITTILTADKLESERLRRIQSNSDFLKHVFYKSKYPIHLSKREGDIFILNHMDQKIERYKNGTLDTEVDIEYVSDNNWLKEIRIDPKTEKIYPLFSLKNAIGIKELNLQDGSVSLVSILDTPVQNYESIRVYDNHLFYLRSNPINQSFKELVKVKL